MYTIDELNEALQICMEFGPERSIPPAARIAARFPSLTAKEVTEFVQLHKRLIQRATDLGEQVVDSRLAQDEAQTQLADSFPMITQEVVQRALSQGCWFAAK